VCVVSALIALMSVTSAIAQQDFITFESAQVRPLAISPDGTRLFATNTPDNQLEVYSLTAALPVHIASIPVGMEPVAVAARSDSEVWVVNHLSDSVSVVDVGLQPPRVVRTLLVGDEPNDIVFAGPGGNRAFVATAHRGQNSPFPLGEYDTPGVGRADVWVFDADNLGSTLGGAPLDIVTLFGDKPRALAVSADGSRVFAAVFRSGNRTVTLNEGLVCNGGDGAMSCTVDGANFPGGLPAPNDNHEGTDGPEVGLIVKFDPDAGVAGEWQDEQGRNWNDAIRFELPDFDVFEIDANATPPAELSAVSGVGTVLFNMVVNPANGRLYVSNTEARTEVRFEGPGTYATGQKPPGEPTTVRGHLHEARITVVDGANVTPRHLNKHIPYDAVPVPAGVKEDSLATPVGMDITSDGSTLYVAAFGSSEIGVFTTSTLEDDTFVPDAANQIPVSGGGPSGLVLDEPRDRLYVLTRFNNSIAVIDLASSTELLEIPLHDVEPEVVTAGRPFLYDAVFTSSNGEASCSSCHVFGDMDDLPWDLGNPDGDVTPNPNPPQPQPDFHPLKGPMTTQTLRGLATHGPMHWRGDRIGTEVQAFAAFNAAFPGLIGRDEGELTAQEMQAFVDFALEIQLPPNPIRQLDNSLRSTEQNGLALFNGQCATCHELDPSQGFFGSNGEMRDGGQTQMFKVPHLRNAYQKVGMFGMPASASFFTPGDNGPTGPQVRGSGFMHDGSTDTVARFLTFPGFGLSDTQRAEIESFIMAFDSNLAPIVGQQATLDSTSGQDVNDRIDLLIQRSATPFVLLGSPGATECDLVVKGVVDGEERGYVRTAAGTFLSDRESEAPLTEVQLRTLGAQAGNQLTFTCAPPGSGTRMGIDRDLDGSLDRDERDAGSDPANPGSTANACNDGIDNDLDGFVDFPADPGCASATSAIENPQCDDGVDNDANGLTDFPADPNCDSAADGSELELLARMESLSLTVGGAPVTAVLTNTYVSPVVVCSVQLVNNPLSVLARVGNVTSNTFDVRLQNPSDEPVVSENVSCLVVEEGTWEIDGVPIEAQTYVSTVTDNSGSWVGESQSYNQAYTNPVVLGQVMSENDARWSVFWSQGDVLTNPPSSTDLVTGKTVCEDPQTDRADETIGIIVIESGHGTIGGVEYEAALGPDAVGGVGNNPPYVYAFNTSFAAAPQVAVTTMAGVDHSDDGGWAQPHGTPLADATTLFLSINEEQILRPERYHGGEQANYVVFATPFAYEPAP
jgi:mono/diheme cytochrome c family protein/sugar lactone lactonase YvrE